MSELLSIVQSQQETFSPTALVSMSVDIAPFYFNKFETISPYRSYAIVSLILSINLFI
ncbi:hypothetical protein J15TS10_22830 [Paenibacillus woosongensis]|uniref:Uncharacterized protein n=1 Tax=Paenibacillus woosongensis TaxID=307580 RepID=A0ABQ4MRB0_9BACL|nr:hypothetical protein J15TS10_22830 [Paenibacillus woosongensis]